MGTLTSEALLLGVKEAVTNTEGFVKFIAESEGTRGKRVERDEEKEKKTQRDTHTYAYTK
jgi:hypothetical protein